MNGQSRDEAIDLDRERRRARSPAMQRRLLSISEACTPEDIADAVAVAAQSIGFPFAQLMVVNTLPNPTTLVMKESSSRMLRFDRAVIVGSDLASDFGDPLQDPLLRKLRQCPLPVVWNGNVCVDARFADMAQWRFGNGRGNGISMQVPLAVDDFSRLLTVVVSVQRAETIRYEEQARLSADVALMAMHAAVGSKRALVPLLLEAAHDASPLTPAMRQYLTWAERGKTAGETAEIVGRKYSTVKNVLAQAIERMGCTGKADAVRLARANGWL